MPFKVTLNDGYSNVALPNGDVLQEGQSVVLIDKYYYDISQEDLDRYFTVEAVADPVTGGMQPEDVQAAPPITWDADTMTIGVDVGTTADSVAAGNHTHTASQITDATTTGRSVLTAADGAAARSAIGAGTSDLTIGTTGTTAAAGNHTHVAANITDSTATGRSVLTAADATAARTAIGAGTSNLTLGTTGTTAAAGNHTHVIANITGLQGALDAKLSAGQGAAVADATDATDVVTQFNALLASLRTAGIIAT